MIRWSVMTREWWIGEIIATVFLVTFIMICWIGLKEHENEKFNKDFYEYVRRNESSR